MSVSEEVLFAVVFALNEEVRKAKPKKRKLWMKERHKKRALYIHQHVLSELSFTSLNDFNNFLRVNSFAFEELLQLIGPLIKKQNTNMRDAIPSDQRLAITLRYLATGHSFENLKFISAVSAQAIGKIVMEACRAIITVLKDYIKVPETQAEWELIAEGFYKNYNFPNCLGAVGGKHVAIKKPNNSGSTYYNHKKFYSIVLKAVVNCNCEIFMVNIDVKGGIAGRETLHQTSFEDILCENTLNSPKPRTLPQEELKLTPSERILPYVFIGDDAFQLTDNILTPFSQIGLTKEQRIFNVHLSRAQRISENTFGILSSRFRVFQRAIDLAPKKVETIVLACCYLHNYLCKKYTSQYLPSGCIDKEDEETAALINGSWRGNFEMESLESTTIQNYTNSAKDTRQQFCEYFNNEGQKV